MGPYAGICGARSPAEQRRIIPPKSLLEISAFLAAGGANCDGTARRQHRPTVARAPPSHPRGTPFTMTATAATPTAIP